MEQISRRQLLHDIRGRLNGLQLCVVALETSPTDAEKLEFIDDILAVADKLERLMLKLEEMIERHPEEYASPEDAGVTTGR
jgi:nitrogen-specific signal transduction histidine kinase